jgi:hypothetical protein
MKNKMNQLGFKKIAIVAFAFAMSVSACKKDDDDVTKPTDTNDEELITTVKFLIRDTDSPNTQFVFQYRDVDGLGGNAPSIDTIKLKADKTYSVELVLLDETKTPFDTISNEILEEAADHLFVFEPSSLNLGVTINDFDNNNPPQPLGLLSSWSTGAATNMNIKVVLKHQPGIKNGDITRGETDIELVMPVVIK